MKKNNAGMFVNFINSSRKSRWSKAEKTELLKLHRNGADIYDISHLLRRSKKSVLKQLIKLL